MPSGSPIQGCAHAWSDSSCKFNPDVGEDAVIEGVVIAIEIGDLSDFGHAQVPDSRLGNLPEAGDQLGSAALSASRSSTLGS